MSALNLPVKVLNLKKRHDRKEHMINLLNTIGTYERKYV